MAAFAVAQALEAPLDVILVCELGVPFQSELATGAIGEGGVTRASSGSRTAAAAAATCRRAGRR